MLPRLTEVYTSADHVYWEKQAGYSYYRHGPLARTELGQLKVQGIDYAYTLQGWLKGVNSNAIGGSFDMGGMAQVPAAPHAMPTATACSIMQETTKPWRPASILL